MSYRCVHCGGYTGETLDKALAATGHGVGVCVSPCHWCNEGTKHSPRVCVNAREGMPFSDMPSLVQDFLPWHRMPRR